MKLILTDDEQSALHELPHLPFRLYFALKRRVDLATGLVGGRYGVSYQALAEDTYVAPEPGIAALRASRWAIDRAAQWLIKRGLVEKAADLRSNRDQRLLIFKLPMQQLSTFVRNKPAPKPHLKPHRVPHRGNPQEPAQGSPSKAALHPERTFANVAANDGGDIAESRAAEKLTWLDGFPQGYPPSDQGQILQVAYANHLDADQVKRLLDELCRAERKAPVRSRPALFTTFVKQLKRGTFFGDQPHRSYGTPLSEDELSMINEGGIAP